MKETTMLPSTFATRTGLILMAAPSLYWVGILLAAGFGKPIIVQGVVIPLEQISPLFSLMIMIGLPLITLLVNLKAAMMVDYRPGRDDIYIDVQYKNNKTLWFMIFYSGLSIAATLYLAFFEKMNVFSLIYA